ncbi:MAG: serine/threonine protein kinase [Betaproteobacteria bacterium]|nr:serine/threonine protein kinase [Betaproteobacteria bacterium]
MHTPIEQLPKFGRYELVSELGRGAMGVVYRAIDPLLERTVAVKTVNMFIEQEGMANYEARFYQEARAAGGLNHPNIVTIYDVGKSGQFAYMAMEFIDGEELRALLARSALPISQAVSIAAQVAEGLAFAHERGVVHRDVKPGNIMVVPGKPVKITDFGIARMRAAQSLTQTGMMLGSPKYMSPEQVLGKRADHHSDIFSLGVILYEMLAGAPPFSGDSVTAVMYQIVHFAPPAPSALKRGVSPMLDQIVAKMLAKEVEGRYQTAAEVALDLRECERLIAADRTAQAIATHPPESFSRGPAPSYLENSADLVLLEQTVERTRSADESLERTQRIARGETPPVAEATAPTVNLGKPPPLPTALGLGRRRAQGWRRRDWFLLAAAGLLGVFGATAIALF